MSCASSSAPVPSASRSSRSIELLRLWRDKQRPSRKVRALAEGHKQTVVARMQAHRAIIKVLSRLIEACKGDDRPDCPILDELSSARGPKVQETGRRK